MSSRALVACPNNRCGVQSHYSGEPAHQRCQAIGRSLQSRISGESSLTMTSRYAASADPDIDSFGVITADAVMVDEDKHSYYYDVELESSSSDASMTVRYGKGKMLVADDGDPTATEVIASLVRERMEYNALMDADDLADTFGFSTDPDYDNPDENGNPGPSQAERTYEEMREQAEKFTALMGDDEDVTLEAIRLTEGDEHFDEVTWRHELGLPVRDSSMYDAYGSPMLSAYFTAPTDNDISSEEFDAEMDRAYVQASAPSDAAAMTAIAWLSLSTGDDRFGRATSGQVNRRDLQEAINTARKGGDARGDLSERDQRDLTVLDQWVREHKAN